MHHFFALLSRMKYIDRWALMRNTSRENISQHSQEVAMLAHALAVLGNCYLGKNYNVERAALLGLYHDATEIITGDMPTPVKYHNPRLRDAYKSLEAETAEKLLDTLPPAMRPYYAPLFAEADPALAKLVKAADKLSAYIKCLEEEKSGNHEFLSAKASIRTALAAAEVEEVDLFFTHFMDAYGKTLDELEM